MKAPRLFSRGPRRAAIAAGTARSMVPPGRGDLNRAHLPALAYLTPWLSVTLASWAPGWLFIARIPLMPPLGLLTLLSWRQLHPGSLPVWAGFPLGLIDDLVSGQPTGSGVLLWSVVMIGLEAIELRWPWRNFWVDWGVAAALIAIYLMLAGVIANGVHRADWVAIVPVQILVSILIYPLTGRIVAWLDRLRLTRFRVTHRFARFSPFGSFGKTR